MEDSQQHNMQEKANILRIWKWLFVTVPSAKKGRAGTKWKHIWETKQEQNGYQKKCTKLKSNNYKPFATNLWYQNLRLTC
jgi:hypothetical protein